MFDGRSCKFWGKGWRQRFTGRAISIRGGLPLAQHGIVSTNVSIRGLATSYNSVGPFVHAISSHSHCTALNEEGELYSWGCGSEGKAGVERFLNMKGERKPSAVDWTKCFLMGPHRVGLARKKYWDGGSALQGLSVVALAGSKNHMACIATPGHRSLTTNGGESDRLLRTKPMWSPPCDPLDVTSTSSPFALPIGWYPSPFRF